MVKTIKKTFTDYQEANVYNKRRQDSGYDCIGVTSGNRITVFSRRRIRGHVSSPTKSIVEKQARVIRKDGYSVSRPRRNRLDGQRVWTSKYNRLRGRK